MRAAVALLALAACGGADGPPGELHITGPMVRDIAPGADVTLCSYLPVGDALDETVDIIGATGVQSQPGGHHAVLYMVQSERPIDTHECTDDDMLNSRYLASAGGGDAGGKVDFIPEGVAYRAEAGKQLMVQTHWINVSTSPIEGNATFDLRVQPPTDDIDLAQLFTWTSTDISIPPGGIGSTRTDCVVQREMAFYHLGGHAHEHGTQVTLTHTPAGGAPTVFYDEEWTAYYSFDPPRIYHAREDAMIVRPGDTLSIDCAYQNDTDEELIFPYEMCTGFGFYFPGESQLDCTDGRWPSTD